MSCSPPPSTHPKHLHPLKFICIFTTKLLQDEVDKNVLIAPVAHCDQNVVKRVPV